MPLQKCNCYSSSQSTKFNESFEFSIVFIGLEERLFSCISRLENRGGNFIKKLRCCVGESIAGNLMSTTELKT